MTYGNFSSDEYTHSVFMTPKGDSVVVVGSKGAVILVPVEAEKAGSQQQGYNLTDIERAEVNYAREQDLTSAYTLRENEKARQPRKLTFSLALDFMRSGRKTRNAATDQCFYYVSMGVLYKKLDTDDTFSAVDKMPMHLIMSNEWYVVK